MAYSELEQFERDIDWFFADANKRIYHVASAGGRLPEKIAQSDRNNRDILIISRKLTAQYEVEINPLIAEIVNFENDYYRERYLESFISFAERGYYSYDKSVLGSFDDPLYHLVAKPKIVSFIRNNDSVLENLIPKIESEIDINDYGKFDLIKLFT